MRSSDWVIQTLGDHFQKKKKEFPYYSYRWLARKLSLSATHVFQIMKGQRRVPPSSLQPLCDLLGIDGETSDLLRVSILSNEGWTRHEGLLPQLSPRFPKELPKKDWVPMGPSDFDVLSDWTYLAILEATLLTDYDGSPEFIARKIGLSIEPCRRAFEDLHAHGYLLEIDGKLRKARRFFDIQSPGTKDRLRAYHRAVMTRAQEELTRTSPEAAESRIITSAAMTCAKKDIPALRVELTRFIKTFAEHCSAGEPDSVYQLGIQFFPLSVDEG